MPWFVLFPFAQNELEVAMYTLINFKLSVQCPEPNVTLKVLLEDKNDKSRIHLKTNRCSCVTKSHNSDTNDSEWKSKGLL